MTDKKTPAPQPQRPGALRSDITVTLNTLYAFNLWRGGGAPASNIPSMNFCLSRLLWINSGSRGDDPYADQMMYRLERLIADSKKVLTELQETINAQLATLPKGVSFTEVTSTYPIEMPALGLSPLGSQCFFLFLQYDEIAKYTLHAFGLGLIDENKKARVIREAGRAVRSILTQIRDWNYRDEGLTRKDVIAQTALAQAAARRWGAPDEDVFWGRHRSSFSPALNAQTVSVLQAMVAAAEIDAVPADDDPASVLPDETGEQDETILPPDQAADPEV
ncbi:PFL_4669 family integrating conjugative element protein [Serratia fonticola]|uniref:PFL_4669 family integrating conjugative element protein n=1 Tax=Serratia fonticola TaxID=47917 RepID=UPI0013783918|nr:TIGR03761 family integrating conjugative element protein [Serratia fonticola]NCG54493.1 TIGR03761 family integrating conjugative element protein [Serratia fonticola]